MPRVVIDQYECFKSMGLTKPVDLTGYEGQGDAAGTEIRRKDFRDGDSIAAVENPQDPMPDIVERDAWPVREFVLDYIPKARPKITVTGGVQIDPEGVSQSASNGVQASYTPPDIRMNYSPAQVRISVAQYPSISMRYVSNRFDKFV